MIHLFMIAIIFKVFDMSIHLNSFITILFSLLNEIQDWYQVSQQIIIRKNSLVPYRSLNFFVKDISFGNEKLTN